MSIPINNLSLVNVIQFIVSFGEIEISQSIVALLIALTAFTFIAVGISSFNLIQSLVGKDKKQ